MPDSIRHTITVRYEHTIHFTEGVFEPTNDLLAEVIAGPGKASRALVFYDQGLLGARPKLPSQIFEWFALHERETRLAAAPMAVPRGEACKNDWRQVEMIWEAIHRGGLCRHGYVIAVGGGAVLDLVGFAAATAHRGVHLVRIPTTSLAQGDGGVGVKNSVNFFGKKNWVGTFAVPTAVINDSAFLHTLPPEELRAGLIEALKVALIRDAELYHTMADQREQLAALTVGPVQHALQRSAALHVQHIATSGDPFERGSARPLDFGHWVAHKLEQLSDFSVGHGQAVSIGMAVDILYSARLGLLAERQAREILALMQELKFPLYHPLLEAELAPGERAILAGLEEFREHLGGELTITLLKDIGQGLEVHEIQQPLMLQVMAELRSHGFGMSRP